MEESKIIKIRVRDRVAFCEENNILTAVNSGDTVEFDFDDEWQPESATATRTARFIYDETYIDIPFNGNICPLPCFTKYGNVFVGVFWGDIRSTTPAMITFTPSILDGLEFPEDPPEDVYNQIIELLNQKVNTEQLETEVQKVFSELKTLSQSVGTLTLSPLATRYYLKAGAAVCEIFCEDFSAFPLGYSATIAVYCEDETADYNITADMLKSESDSGMKLEDLKTGLAQDGMMINIYKSTEDAFNWELLPAIVTDFEQAEAVLTLKPDISRYHLTSAAATEINCEDFSAFAIGYSAEIMFYNPHSPSLDEQRIETAILKEVSDNGLALSDLKFALANDGIVLNIYKCTEDAFNWYLSTAKGAEGKSAYEVAFANGFGGTEQEWLESLKGEEGKSAFEIAVENGFDGTEDEWLESLKGEEGGISVKSAEAVLTLVPETTRYFLKSAAATEINCDDFSAFPLGYSAGIVFYNPYSPSLDEQRIETTLLKEVSDGGMALSDLKFALANDGIVLNIYKSTDDAFNWYLSAEKNFETWTFELEDGTTVTKNVITENS